MANKIAFVCDWLTGMRGGEKCLLSMCNLYPDADIFSLVYYPGSFNGEFDGHRIFTSFIQNLPGGKETFRKYLPLFPVAIESFDLSRYDLVVSFSHCVAKGVRVPEHIPHICYCYTPVRYVWDMRCCYLAGMSPCKKRAVSWLLDRIQNWDVRSSGRVTRFVAISNYIQQRISRCYGRDSEVIYPPVDLERFEISTKDDGYYLALSAMVPYKRIDLAVEAFNLNGRRLIVAGEGPEYDRLKQKAKHNIEFVSAPDDQLINQLYAGCRALIFPGEEDFGIVPVEAQACGKPVIAFAGGGALETVVVNSKNNARNTGVLFDIQTPDCLDKAVERFEKTSASITADNCRKNALRFDQSHFETHMLQLIQRYCESGSYTNRA